MGLIFGAFAFPIGKGEKFFKNLKARRRCFDPFVKSRNHLRTTCFHFLVRGEIKRQEFQSALISASPKERGKAGGSLCHDVILNSSSFPNVSAEGRRRDLNIGGGKDLLFGTIAAVFEKADADMRITAGLRGQNGSLAFYR